MLHLRRKGQEGFAVHVLHHRHDQALERVGGDAEVVVAFDDQVPLVVGERSIERRMLLQGSHHRLHDEWQQGQVDVRRGVAARPPIEQFADVHFVNRGDRHGGCGRLNHCLGDGAPQGGQWLKLDRPMRILLRARGLLGRFGALRGGLQHVLAADAAARPGRGDAAQVHPKVAGQPAHRRNGENPPVRGCAVL